MRVTFNKGNKRTNFKKSVTLVLLALGSNTYASSELIYVLELTGVKSSHYYAWAVQSGDVASVSVPAAVWFFGSGLVGLLSFTSKKNKTDKLSYTKLGI